MRNSLIISLILNLVFSLGCGFNTDVTESRPAADDAVILEICTEASELIYPPGKILDIRLYRSGELEFDKYSPEPDIKNIDKLDVKRERSKLSADELQTVITSLRDQRLYDSQDLYQTTLKMRDIDITKTIKITFEGKTKQITLEENDNHLHLEKKTNIYPEPLLDLLKRAEAINKNLLADH